MNQPNPKTIIAVGIPVNLSKARPNKRSTQLLRGCSECEALFACGEAADYAFPSGHPPGTSFFASAKPCMRPQNPESLAESLHPQ